MKLALSFVLFIQLTFAQTSSHGIVEKIIRTKNVICDQDHPVSVFYHRNHSAFKEHTMDSFLKSVNDPITVTTTFYHYINTVHSQSCSILFVENCPKSDYMHYMLDHRMLIITSRNYFHTVSDQFIAFRILSAVYLIHDESQQPVYHYNRYHGDFDRWNELAVDPTIQAARNLHGFGIHVLLEVALDVDFMDQVLISINGTRRMLSNDSVATLLFIDHVFSFSNKFQFIYMHRFGSPRLLVPMMNRAKPMLHSFLDPFDVETWLIYLVTILALALLQTCCSGQYTLRQLWKSAKQFLSCTMLGNGVIFYRELDRLAAGLFQLSNVVLMTAYESLVISFLLSLRFYPELDTIELVNETCRWPWSHEYERFDLRHYNRCSEKLGTLKHRLDAGREERCCYMANERFIMIYNDHYTREAAQSGYRWSKAEIHKYPRLAAVDASPGMIEILSFHAAIFYAEGALYKAFERMKVEVVDRSAPRKSIGLNDLSLVLVIYLVGLSVSMVAFIGEFVCSWMDRLYHMVVIRNYLRMQKIL